MTNQKAINNFKTVITVLENDRDKLAQRLANLKNDIHRKTASVNKIIQYKESYQQASGDQVRFKIPALYQNMAEFTKKIDNAIQAGQADIDELEHRKIGLIQEIEKLDNKLHSLNSYVEKQEKAQRVIDENREIEASLDMVAQLKQD